MEGVKRRRLVVEESSTSTVSNSSNVIETVSEREAPAGETSVFDLDLLDCTICTEPLAAPIYQCENGHVACASCSKLTKNVCPSCKQPTGSIRCLALEKLIESLKVKCKYYSLGCSEMVKFSDKCYHERICSWEPLACPFPECSFQGQYNFFQEHVKLRHGDNWAPLVPETDVSFFMKPTDRYYMLFDKGIYFMVHRRKSSLGDMCYLSLPKVLSACYGTGTSFHYKMEIKTVSNVDGATLSSFKVDAHCCNEDSKASSIPKDGFLIVPEDRSVEVSVLFLPPRLSPKFGNSSLRWGDP